MAYKLVYNDCSQPKNINKLNAHRACIQNTTTDIMTNGKPYELLQRVDELTTRGWKCFLEVSDFLMYCGSFSHTKIMRTPIIDRPTPVKPEQCNDWVTSQTFQPPGVNGEKDLQLGGTTIITANTLGVIHPEGTVSCEGQEMRFGDTIIEDVLELTQYKITLLEETFEVRGNRMESMTDHIRLPKDCTVERLGCLTDAGTYIWDPLIQKCHLRRVQTVNLQEEGFLMVDHTHKIVFELGGQITTPIGCPPEATVWSTKWRKLYLTTSQDFQQMSGVDVDIALYSDTRVEYLSYALEREVNGLTSTLSTQLCETSYGTRTNEIIRLQGTNNFGLRRGDVFLAFNCPERIGTIAKPDGMCWDSIQLDNGLFVDVVTRVAKKHAKQTDCSAHFPLYVQTHTGLWITVAEEIKVVDPPDESRIVQGWPPHESFTTTGLYTQEELTSWEMLASWGSYHDAISTKISQGVCRQDGGPCARTVGEVSVAEYDLSRLLASAGIESPMAKMNKFVQNHVGWLCIVVLLIYGVQWTIAIVMSLYSLVADGLGTALGGLYVTFCPTPHMFARMRHNELRRKRKEAQEQVELLETAQLDPVH